MDADPNLRTRIFLPLFWCTNIYWRNSLISWRKLLERRKESNMQMRASEKRDANRFCFRSRHCLGKFRFFLCEWKAFPCALGEQERVAVNTAKLNQTLSLNEFFSDNGESILLLTSDVTLEGGGNVVPRDLWSFFRNVFEGEFGRQCFWINTHENWPPGLHD